MATKTLGILVEAQGAAKAAGLIGKVDQSVQRLGSRTGVIGRFSGAMGKATSRIGGLVSSMGPLLGVAGIAGIGAAFGSSLSKATEFGVTVSKLQGVLGLSADTTSALVDTLDKFGISGDKQVTVLGRMEKNVAALAPTTKKAAEFQKKYAFNLLGTNGQIADANTLLLRSADYYKSNAKATDKATVLNKLYGKTWAGMIPVLALGSKGIKEEEKNAIHLTKAQLDNIGRFKVAQRNFADTIGDLQVKVGAELMPAITGALQTVSTWLDGHSGEVVSFFKGAADFGAQLADGASKAFGAIQTGWNMIPGPLKTLLIEGLIAGKVSKFLFDFGPMDFAKLGSGLIKGVLGMNAGVVNINAGVVNGGGVPGTPMGGPGGITTIAAAIPVVAAVAATVLSTQDLLSKTTLAERRANGGLRAQQYQGSAAAMTGPPPGSALTGNLGRNGPAVRLNPQVESELSAMGRFARSSAPSQESMKNHLANLERLQGSSVATDALNASRIVAAIQSLKAAIGRPPTVNVNVTAADNAAADARRKRTVKSAGPRNSVFHASGAGA